LISYKRRETFLIRNLKVIIRRTVRRIAEGVVGGREKID